MPSSCPICGRPLARRARCLTCFLWAARILGITRMGSRP